MADPRAQGAARAVDARPRALRLHRRPRGGTGLRRGAASPRRRRERRSCSPPSSRRQRRSRRSGSPSGLGAEETAGAYAGGLTNTPGARGVAGGAEGDRAGGELRRGLGPDPRRLLARLPDRGDDRAARGVRGRSASGARRAVDGTARRSSSAPRSSTTAGWARSADVRESSGGAVAFGRVKRGEALSVASRRRSSRYPAISSRWSGRSLPSSEAVALLGRESAERVELERGEVDFRRIVVSSRAVAGLTLADLDLPEAHGGIVTRVRRGDVDMVAAPELVLELGDRVRVVAPPEQDERDRRSLRRLLPRAARARRALVQRRGRARAARRGDPDPAPRGRASSSASPAGR